MDNITGQRLSEGGVVVQKSRKTGTKGVVSPYPVTLEIDADMAVDAPGAQIKPIGQCLASQFLPSKPQYPYCLSIDAKGASRLNT
jgi:hypothetical protein